MVSQAESATGVGRGGLNYTLTARENEPFYLLFVTLVASVTWENTKTSGRRF